MPNPLRTTALLILALALTPFAMAAPAAPGESQLPAANALIVAPAGNTPADPILFPAVAAMRDMPAFLTDWQTASLLTTKSKDWPAVETWAMREPQRKALEALAKVADPKAKSLFVLPYDSKGVDAAWVKAGLVIEPTAGRILAGAEFKYLDALKPLLILATVEGERLAAAGDGAKALKVLSDTLRLGRIICSRPSLKEKRFGMTVMQEAGERMRDLVYQHPDAFKTESLDETVIALDERLIEVMRIRLPEYDRLAVEQVIELAIAHRGEVDAGKLGALMSRLSAGDRPLTRFSEAAKWKKIAAVHAGWFDTNDELQKLWGDWTARWNLSDLHDPQLRKPSDYQKMTRGKFALLDETVGPVDQMRDARLRLLTDMSGTRAALAVVALAKKTKALPPKLQAVIPDHAKRDQVTDFFAYDKRYRTLGQLEYFVPIRDQTFGARELPHPHEISVKGSSTPMSAASAAAADSGPDLEMFKRLDKGIIDDATGRVNVEKLQSELRSEARKEAVEDKDQAEVRTLMTMMKLMEGSSQSVDKLIELGMAAAPADKLKKTAEAIGLTTEEYKAFIAASTKGLTESQKIKDLKTKLGTSTTIADEDVISFREATIDVMTTPEMVDRYITKIIKAAIAEEDSATSSGSSDSFTVQLDDKVFVLFSVGPDVKDNKARNVGEGGDDILYWPPVLSLTREQHSAG